MKNKLIKYLPVLGLIIIGYIIFKSNEIQNYGQQEIKNISNAFGQVFEHARQKATSQPRNTSQQQNQTARDTSDIKTQQAIIAVIYKKTNATWFIKGIASVDKINKIEEQFAQLFINQLKFDANENPLLNHIPENFRATNSSSMRFASYNIEGVDISVSRLEGQQDTYANVKRWMKQIGLEDNANIKMDIIEGNQTIFVKMPE